MVLVVTLPEDTILNSDLSTGLYGQTMLKSSFLCGIILQECNFRMKKKEKRGKIKEKRMHLLSRVFSFHISSSAKHFVKVRKNQTETI